MGLLLAEVSGGWVDEWWGCSVGSGGFWAPQWSFAGCSGVMLLLWFLGVACCCVCGLWQYSSL